MEAIVRPEPLQEERQALLEALSEREQTPYESAWRDAALREDAEGGDS